MVNRYNVPDCPLAKIAVLKHRTGNLCLDKVFDLIEGHPPMQL